MKVEVSSKASPLMDQNSSSPPKSAFARLCRKLSPKRSSADHKKPSLGVNSDDDQLQLAGNSKPSSWCTEMERVFRYVDSDGDGKVSPAELQSSVRAVGGELSAAEAESAVQGLDSDGDGLLGLEDFAKLMDASGGEEKEREEVLREVFGMYEMDRSGCITPKSLKRMLSRLGESRTIEECRAMISVFDVNGDGVLSFQEFTAMMR